jgi:hypothetical protein
MTELVKMPEPYNSLLQVKQNLVYVVVAFVVYYAWVTSDKASVSWVRNKWVQLVLFLVCAVLSEKNSAVGLLAAVAVIVTLLRAGNVSEPFCSGSECETHDGTNGELQEGAHPELQVASNEVPVSETQNDDQYVGGYEEQPYVEEKQQYETPYSAAPDVQDELHANVAVEESKQPVESVAQVREIVKSVTEQAELETGVKLSEQKKDSILKEVTNEVVDMGKSDYVFSCDVVHLCRKVYKEHA